ncbi:MAG: SNF2-related protein, partial [Pseudomonadota bacterium]
MTLFSRRDVQQQFPPPSYKRGVNYWLQDRVLSLSSTRSDSVDGVILKAKVEGSEYEPYHVEVEVTRTPRGHVEFESTCSCPVGHRCKHSAAALLKALDTPELSEFRHHNDPALSKVSNKTESFDEPASRFNVVSIDKNGAVTVEMEGATDSDDSRLRPAPSRPLQNWLSRLGAAGRQSKRPAKTNNPAKHRLLYVLNFKPAVSRDDNVVVEFTNARVLKSGDYGVTSAFRGNMEAKFVLPSDYTLVTWLRSIREESWHGYTSSIMMPRRTPTELMRQLMETERCHWANPKAKPLSLGPEKSCEAFWDEQTGGVQKLSFRTDSSDDLILPFNPPWYIDPKNSLCGPLATTLNESIIDILLDAPSVQPGEVDIVREQFQAQLPEAPEPQTIKTVQRKVEPRPCLRLFNETFRRAWSYQWNTPETITIPLARLSFDYDGIIVTGFDKNPLQPLSNFDESTGELVEIKRDTRIENQARRRLKEVGLHTLQGQLAVVDYQIPDENRNDLFVRDAAGADDLAATQALLRFNAYEVPKLQTDGWQVEVDSDYLFQVVDPELLDDWYADIDDGSGMDWFGLELGIVVEGDKLNLLPLLVDLLKSLSSTDELRLLKDLPGDTLLSVRMEDNKVLPIPLERVRHILDTLIELLEEEPLDENGQLRMLNLRAAQLLELEAAMGAARLRWLGGQKLLDLGRKLKDFQGVQPAKIPDDFQTELRPYQQAGVDWLQFLREYNLAGVLADDMGLGKTVQTLAHLLIEKHAGRLQNPCMVVAPTSLMTNWKLEAQRFAPALKTLVLHGPERKEKFDEIAEHDLILTTYALLPRDKELLMPHRFHLLILDEAQNIKNPKAKATQIAHQLNAEHRLCLTGTPMENHLGELWSLFHFLMPGLLGDTASFRFLFRSPIEKYDDRARRDILARRVAPFMLRRKKEAVIEELPDKNEILRTIELNSGQRDLYETIRLTMHEKVRRQIAERGLARSQIIILDALLKLRQICCDPRLLKMDAAKNVQHSGR